MKDYDEYLEMLKKSIWNLYYSGLIDIAELNTIKSRFYTYYEDREEKKKKAFELRNEVN